ncbi:hypothetical protein V8F20_009072 [Naviculisporaceae sp. PSN 640]
MADALEVELNRLLSDGHTGVQRALSKIQREGRSLEWMTTYLLGAIETEAVPATAFDHYLNACNRDLNAVQSGLKQTHNELVREVSIRHFIRLIRSGTAFTPAWEAIGGARGLAILMRQWSVSHVKLLCKGLGTTVNITEARFERQSAISDLFELLCGFSKPGSAADLLSDSELSECRDPRPLRPIYFKLMRGCPPEACLRWYQEQFRPVDRANFERMISRSGPDAHRVRLLLHFAKLEPRTSPVKLWSAMSSVQYCQERMASFTLGVFRLVVAAGPSRFAVSPADILDKLATPLLKQLQKHTHNRETKAEIWGLIFKAYETWPSLGKATNYAQWSQYSSHAVTWWNWAISQESQIDALRILKKLLALIPPDSYGFTLPHVTELLIDSKISAPRRYELFCIFLQHFRRFNLNIDSPTENDKHLLRSLSGANLCELFTFLPPSKSLKLLEIYTEPEHYTGKVFVHVSTHPLSIFRHRTSVRASSKEADVALLKTFLRHQASGEPQTSLQYEIDHRINEAKKHGPFYWNKYMFWATSALFLSIATGDLDTYSRTLTWALDPTGRDREMIGLLYSQSDLGTKEGLHLLAGLPAKERLHLRSMSQVKADILSGNKIVSQLLGLVRGCIKRFGYSRSDSWSFVVGGGLVSNIFQTRAKLAEHFQKYHGLSDDEVFALVWKPTIDLVLDVEAFALEDGHLKFSFYEARGIIGLKKIEGYKMSANLWKFFDQLAQERDRLWSNIRGQKFPNFPDLPSLWPRGLPAHLLCNIDPSRRFNSSKIPFILSRVKRVVFADPEDAFSPLPVEETAREAVGDFVESYGACFKIYLDADGEDGTTREGRSEMAWNYATTILSQHMSTEEANRYWRGWVKDWAHFNRPQPTFGGGKTKGLRPDRRDLVPMYLDMMIRAAPGERLIHWLFSMPNYPRSTRIDPPRPQDSVFKCTEIDFEGNRESLIAAALRHFEVTSEQFLKPVTIHFGDEELCMDTSQAKKVLRRFRYQIPASTLRELALKGIEEADEVQMMGIEDLIQVVVGCSRPGEACSLIRKLLASSRSTPSTPLHKLVAGGFLNRLPADSAKSFLQNLSNEVCDEFEAERAEEVKRARCSGTSFTYDDKHTRVKVLAEIVVSTMAVDLETAAVILMRIFRNTRNMMIGGEWGTIIDSKGVSPLIVKTMLQFFEKTESDKFREWILAALRDYALDLAAELSESWPMSAEDWKEAEATISLPRVVNNRTDISRKRRRETRPIAKALVGSLTLARLDNLGLEWKTRWFTEIFMGIMRKSIANNKRWMKLFLAKIRNRTVSEDMLPPAPADPSLLGRILKDWGEVLTVEALEIMQRFALFYIDIPEPIREINRAIRKKTLGITSDHWGRCCGGGPRPSESPELMLEASAFLVNLRGQELPTKRLNQKIENIGNFLLNVMESLVIDYPSALHKIMEDVIFGYTRSHNYRCTWRSLYGYQNSKTYLHPIARHAIQLVDTIRDIQTQRPGTSVATELGLGGDPASLPDTFVYRVYMLPLPSTLFQKDEPSPEDDISKLCGEILTLIDYLVDEAVDYGEPYQENWDLLVDFMCKEPGSWKMGKWNGDGLFSSADFLRIAVELWRLHTMSASNTGRYESMSDKEQLRVSLVLDLANRLIRGSDASIDNRVENKEMTLKAAREALALWLESDDDWTRDVAFNTLSAWHARSRSTDLRKAFEDLWEGNKHLKRKASS